MAAHAFNHGKPGIDARNSSSDARFLALGRDNQCDQARLALTGDKRLLHTLRGVGYVLREPR